LSRTATAPPIADVAAAAGLPSGSYSPALKRLGRTDYTRTWRAMQDFTDARTSDTRDEVWLTEHAPIYTLGLAGRPEHILRANAIPVLKVDRGGQVTYHGPGQLMVYLLIDLRRLRLGVRQLVVAIESAVIKFLGSYGIEAYGRRDAPGVYVRRDGREAKVAALGLKIRNGCTYHGFALNLDMDLAPFDDIDPCGYRGLAVTQLRDLDVDVRASRTEIEERLVSQVTQSIATATMSGADRNSG
jgi:lipoyl(octanoyl) transferase